MKVFIGTTEISGIATGLTQGLSAAGIDVEKVLRTPHPFAYDRPEKEFWVVKVWQFLHRSNERALVLRIIAKFLRFFWGFVVLAWAIRRFDVFLFLFGVGITDTVLELRVLRALKKKVIFFYVGSDERPPYLDGAICLASPIPDIARVVELSLRKRKRIQTYEKYASFCIGSPFSGHFHQRPFVKCFSLGIPKHFKVRDVFPESCQAGQKVRILHAPSLSACKGTLGIDAVVESLIKKGLPIEYVRLENVSNDVVLEEIGRCDFVIDQLYSDTPMAAFPTEAANLGKPSVVGGYLAPHIKDYLSAEDIAPTLFVHPDELSTAVEKLVVDEAYRLELGRQAKAYVDGRWSAAEIARRYIRLIEGDIPPEWWFDPAKIGYYEGYGFPQESLQLQLRSILKIFGISAFGVSDKPELETKLVQFAFSESDDQ